jgi:hypothetical protein
MRGFVFGEMLDALERLAALFAAVLVGRHASPPESALRVRISMVRGGANAKVP